ncbi:MAG: NAD-dependent epimerase/dehydratase family protein, partial [Actinomycetota bacterium]|nr:NAD-dependent epimerase/dehydratase family protein [Actinomycetota bacterium]
AGPREPERLDAGCFEPPCPTCGADLAAEAAEETAPADPRNVYAATKLHQEHLCAAYGREHASTTVALRYHNVYGPRMPRDTPYAGVASIFRGEILAGRPAQVFEDGRQIRDFVHVTDVARANALALTAPLDSGFAAFNICSGVPRTVGELAEALSTGVPPVLTGKWRPGDVRHVFASPAKAWERLGFRATTTLTEGLASLSE